jgi:hypothetical protein
MSTITINNINGVPPYDIYVCDIYELNCTIVTSGVTSVPPPVTFSLPPKFQTAPTVIIKIIDSQNCIFRQNYTCVTATPTKTVTPTNTQTPSITPSNTVTPTNTQTQVTPTPTPSITSTNTQTPTVTPTPSITPSLTSPPTAGTIMAIEPISGSSIIGNYLYSQGSNFFGFSNGVLPPTDPNDFNYAMNKYIDYFFENGTGGGLVSFPFTNGISGNTDLLGNRINPPNFQTIKLSSTYSNVLNPSWFTFLIPVRYLSNYAVSSITGNTQAPRQRQIGLSLNDSNIFSVVNMNPQIYELAFQYTGNNIFRTWYFVYTSFPSPEFLLDNSTNIYFKGVTVK